MKAQARACGGSWIARTWIMVLVLGGVLATPTMATAQSKDVLIFAAASLKNALDDVNALYQHDTGKHANISYAASSALAKQIENGAPADIFISADLDWMNYLAKANLIKPDTRKDVLGNELVIVAPKDSTLAVKIAPGFPLAKLLAGGKLAMADTNAVPAGKYGKAALEKLGVWSVRLQRHRPGGECACRASPGGAQGSPARHRLSDRCRRRAEREDRRDVSRGHPSADHLSRRFDRDLGRSGCGGVPRLHGVGQGAAGLREAGLHRPQIGAGMAG